MRWTNQHMDQRTGMQHESLAVIHHRHARDGGQWRISRFVISQPRRKRTPPLKAKCQRHEKLSLNLAAENATNVATADMMHSCTGINMDFDSLLLKWHYRHMGNEERKRSRQFQLMTRYFMMKCERMRTASNCNKKWFSKSLAWTRPVARRGDFWKCLISHVIMRAVPQVTSVAWLLSIRIADSQRQLEYSELEKESVSTITTWYFKVHWSQLRFDNICNKWIDKYQR